LSPVTAERAERIAKSQPCARCGEFSFKRMKVKAATAAQRDDLAIAWQVTRSCGVCGAEEELGIDEDGDVVYAG
jgi:hypothetical protein